MKRVLHVQRCESAGLERKMKYELKERVRYSETDECGRLSLLGLVNLLQDVTVFHSEDVGYGIEVLKNRNQGWIISSWQIDLLQDMPKTGEEVCAVTWAHDFRSFFGQRCYQLLDSRGLPLAQAHAHWILYDAKAGRPVRVDETMAKAFDAEQKLDMEYAPRKLMLPKSPKEVVRAEDFLVGREALDSNHHVNNEKYIAFAMAYLSEEQEIHRLRVEYKSQARLGDRICPVIYRQENAVLMALNSEDGMPYALVEFS